MQIALELKELFRIVARKLIGWLIKFLHKLVEALEDWLYERKSNLL